MARTPRVALLLALTAVVDATFASLADAAKRKVPFGFFGANSIMKDLYRAGDDARRCR